MAPPPGPREARPEDKLRVGHPGDACTAVAGWHIELSMTSSQLSACRSPKLAAFVARNGPLDHFARASPGRPSRVARIAAHDGGARYLPAPAATPAASPWLRHARYGPAAAPGRP